MKQKKGISLIVLVIEIIVILIISGAVIISLTSTNVIDMGEKSEREWNISTVREQLIILKTNKLLENNSNNNEILYGHFSKYGIDIGNLENKILIEDDKLVYVEENVTKEEAKHFESNGILKSSHYAIVSLETKNTKYKNAPNVGTYENFVTAVNNGEFTPNDNGEVKYKIAYLDEDIDLGNYKTEKETWANKYGDTLISLPTIEVFNGMLDGQGYMLKGIYENKPYGYGLVNTNNGVIKNLKLDGEFTVAAVFARSK